MTAGPRPRPSLLARVLVGLIGAYQGLSAARRPACRFTPSCSQYAAEALQAHRLPVALRLAARRLSRCHPWGGFGYDPVPGPSAAEGPRRTA